MKDYTIFNGRTLTGDVRQELEKKDKEIKELKDSIQQINYFLETIKEIESDYIINKTKKENNQ